MSEKQILKREIIGMHIKTSILVLVVVAICQLVFSFIYFQDLILQEKLKSVEKLSKSIGQNLGEQNYINLDTIIGNELSSHGYDGISIYDLNGKVISLYGIKSDVYLFNFKGDQYYKLNYDRISIYSKIYHKGKQISYISLSLPHSNFSHIVKIQFAFFMLLTALVVILTYLVSSRMQKDITEPVEKLNFILKDLVKEGQSKYVLSEQSDYFKYKEYADLVNLINSLYSRITDYSKQLYTEKGNVVVEKESKINFLRDIGHEIRTSLNSMMGVYDVLDEIEMTREQKRVITVFQKSSNNLLAVFNDLLDLSGLESGKISLSMMEYNLKESMSSIAERYEVLAKEKGLEFSFDFDSKIQIDILFDRLRLEKTITKVLDNSINFTHDGAIQLLVEQISSSQISQKIKFSIVDSGLSLTEKKYREIVDQFKKGEAIEGKKFTGHGLGITIASMLAELFGDKLIVQTIVGEKTEYSFTLDIQMAHAQVSDRVVSENKAIVNLANKRALVVEDNSDNILIVERYLKSTNIHITTASNGVEGLDQFKAGEFDIILMDIEMPLMDGLEATRKIRELEREQNLKRTPIFALTAYTEAEDVKACSDAGCDGHLAKPIRKKLLISTLSNTLK